MAQNGDNKSKPEQPPGDDDYLSESGGIFRGIAATFRGTAGLKSGVRALGQARPLAFASEGGVAGKSMIPKSVYYGAWGLSGAAIAADITTKYWDAPDDKKTRTAGYWTLFHIPASLVIPAYIIHQVVHVTDHAVNGPSRLAKAIPPRWRPLVPVAAALLSIIPVVPTVDYLAEAAMEPTLGKALGLEFSGHGHGEVKKED